jgi:DNA ligase-1
MRPGNTLGALRVKHPAYEEDFGIGTGFDAAQRDYLWANRDTLLGALVKFKHQPSGAKDKPRFPVYLGIRRD